MTDYAHLQIDTQANGVRTITLDRAEKLNAVNGALAASLAAALNDSARADEVRVVVLTGAGRAFCSGLDLSAPPELPTATRAERGEARASESMRFASAVAGFGMLLRHSPNAGALTWRDVIALGNGARGSDAEGYRAEFVRLAETAASLSGTVVAQERERRR